MISRLAKLFFLVFPALILTVISACKEKKNVDPEVDPQITFKFTNSWDTEPVNMDTTWFSTQGGDKVKIEYMAYRLSHFRFYRPDGSSIDLGNYEIIQQGSSSQQLSFALKGLPE